jgi:hypothetical protein
MALHYKVRVRSQASSCPDALPTIAPAMCGTALRLVLTWSVTPPWLGAGMGRHMHAGWDSRTPRGITNAAAQLVQR